MISKHLILFFLTFTFFLTPNYSFAVDSILDSITSGDAGTQTSTNNTESYAITFSYATANYTVTKVSWYGEGANNEANCQIYATDSGTHKPTGTALASGNIDTGCSFTNWCDATMDSPVELTAGTRYAMACNTINSSTIRWRWRTEGVHEGFYSTDSRSSWFGTDEYLFKIWGYETPTPTPTPTPTATASTSTTTLNASDAHYMFGILLVILWCIIIRHIYYAVFNPNGK